MGQPAVKLDDLIARAGASVVYVAETQRRASTSAKEALRQLETSVMRALGGTGFRGMPNLASAIGGEPYWGFLVHAQRAVFNERQGLAIDRSGRLVFVCSAQENYRGERWVVRHVQDVDIKALDFAPIVRAYHGLLSDHAARTVKAAAGYEEVQRLAERLKSLVSGAF